MANNAVMNIGVQISLCDPTSNYFFLICSEMELLDRMVICIFFKELPYCFQKCSHTILHFHQQ